MNEKRETKIVIIIFHAKKFLWGQKKKSREKDK